MYVKNFLHAGDLVSAVPVGLEVTLQYDDEGRLHKVLQGYEESGKDISVDVLPAIRKHNLVPLNISIKNGTSFVKGVFVISSYLWGSGSLPDAFAPTLIQAIVDSAEDIKFYAGNIFSYAASFRGGTPIRQWLQMAGFEVLPAMLISASTTEEVFQQQLARNEVVPLAVYCTYMIHRGSQFLTPSLQLTSHIVEFVDMYQSPGGFFRAKVHCNDIELDIAWTDVFNFNIQPVSTLILTKDRRIVRCLHEGVTLTPDHQFRHMKVDDTYDPFVKCPVCHKIIRVPGRGQFMCDDPMCVSHRYPEVIHFCEVLNLPVISYDRYLQIVKGHQTLFSLLDLFDCEEYKDAKISATLSRLIQAFLPDSVPLDEKVCNLFCSECQNSINTVEYYLTHPELISAQLHIDKSDIGSFVNWAKDPANTVDLITSFHFPNITIVATDRKFNGLPMLRAEKICLTGRFSHGTAAEVAMILRSYSAEVRYTFEGDTTCVIVGDKQEETDARIIKSAKELGVPVITESAFFKKFDIDSDLHEDL